MFRVRLALVVMAVVVLASASASTNAQSLDGSYSKRPVGPIKNLIVLVPDGCNQAVQTVARWYKGEPLHLDGILRGAVETWMSNSVVTDSASAATAFATGYKTYDGFLSVGPRDDDFLSTMDPADLAEPYAPLATILEGARLANKSVGLVATSRVSHATPAAYASHNHSRNDENGITEHMVYQNLDVVLGGGFRYLIPSGATYTTSFGATWKGSRSDGENLYDELMARGYQIVDSRTGLMGLSSGKVWGMFGSSHMQPDMDRAQFAPTEPSLAEMTDKAIELLSKDRDGFFLMVEGSQVDWAGHNNDPIYDVTDFLAFDDAVGVALDFAKQDGRTVVMAFPDHTTGGLTLGNRSTNGTYTSVSVEDTVDVLKGMQLTSAGVEAKLGGDYSVDSIKATVKAWWGIDLTDDDVAAILALQAGDAGSFNYALARYVSEKYTVFGWTTHGHHGEDVPLYAYEPIHVSIVGLYDNTQLATMGAGILGFSLPKVQQQLFVNVEDAGFDSWELDFADPKNPVLVVTKGGTEGRMPVSKDLLYMGGKAYRLKGLVVHAPVTGDVHIPKDAISLVK